MRSKSYLVHSATTVAALLLVAPVAQAQEAEADAEATAPRLGSGLQLALRLEPGLAMALTAPQSGATEAGFGHAVKLSLGLTPFLEVGPSASFTTLPATASMADAETAWTFGAGARFMRPHGAAGGRRGFYAVSPWIDADLLYVRTGELDRPGFAAAAGLTMPVDRSRMFWIGPFARYTHIFQGDRAGFDNRDAKILSLGVSFELGSGIERERTRTTAIAASDARDMPRARPVADSDRDQDGVSDQVDSCPDVAGSLEDSGCPPHETLVVPQDQLEVKNKIAFKWDSAELDEASSPALDEVVRALQDKQGFRAEVEGHTSSDGDASHDPHNQKLSEQRATAVLDYLVAHGVGRERLTARGFSSSVPLNTNRTAAGRVTNRRVEFAVHLILVNDRTTP